MDNHGITDKKKPAVGVSAGQKLIKIGTHNRSKRVPILKSAAIYGVSATEQAAESEWLTPMSYVHYQGCYNHLGSVYLGYNRDPLGFGCYSPLAAVDFGSHLGCHSHPEKERYRQRNLRFI
ncbi:hypothetical protein [Acinetobacter radioresistens]|uniref:hypothetical protein n=1 Tax=Acinetobacter radioresistens TaxID=40216 RepID=UPI002003C733|nr:hypothetical protein [Acinetobacter radioresistens]